MCKSKKLTKINAKLSASTTIISRKLWVQTSQVVFLNDSKHWQCNKLAEKEDWNFKKISQRGCQVKRLKFEQTCKIPQSDQKVNKNYQRGNIRKKTLVSVQNR